MQTLSATVAEIDGHGWCVVIGSQTSGKQCAVTDIGLDGAVALANALHEIGGVEYSFATGQHELPEDGLIE